MGNAHKRQSIDKIRKFLTKRNRDENFPIRPRGGQTGRTASAMRAHARHMNGPQFQRFSAAVDKHINDAELKRSLIGLASTMPATEVLSMLLDPGFTGMKSSPEAMHVIVDDTIGDEVANDPSNNDGSFVV